MSEHSDVGRLRYLMTMIDEWIERNRSRTVYQPGEYGRIDAGSTFVVALDCHTVGAAALIVVLLGVVGTCNPYRCRAAVQNNFAEALPL